MTIEGVFPDVHNRTVYVVLDSAPMSVDAHYLARFTLDDRNPGIATGESSSLEQSMNLTDRQVFFDGYDAENGTFLIAEGGVTQSHRLVGAGDAANIIGNTTLAPGSELFVRMEEPDGGLVATATTQVNQRGTWMAQLEADTDYFAVDTELVFVVQDELGVVEANATGVIVESEGFTQIGDRDRNDDDRTQRSNDDEDGINMVQVIPLLALLAGLGGAVYYVIR